MSIPETITRVFTKYDAVIQQINVPVISEVRASYPITDDAEIPFLEEFWFDVPFTPVARAEGMEGVVFVTYGREPKLTKDD